MSELVVREVPFTAGDGFQCNLINVRLAGVTPSRGPVVLVHGAGVRANIFRAPVETTIVDYLLARQHDVWLENWRASIDLPKNEWTLDDAAVHDHPAAVRTIVKETGAPSVKAIIHCQGSTSFMMSAAAGLVPEVDCIVTNAVSLHPIVPSASAAKLKYAVPGLSKITKFLNPQWGLHSPDFTSKTITAMVKAIHHECDNMVCKYASFTYGAGHPTLWRHENLNPQTHEWLKGEFANVPLTFFQQMAKSVEAGQLLSVKSYPSLPANFATTEPKTTARMAFFSGEFNACFLPESQRRTHEFFSRFRKDYHTLNVVPSYGHLDIFMGQRAAQDVFPLIAAELER